MSQSYKSSGKDDDKPSTLVEELNKNKLLEYPQIIAMQQQELIKVKDQILLLQTANRKLETAILNNDENNS